MANRLINAPRLVLGDIMQPQANSFGVVRLAMALSVLVSHAVFFVTGNSQSEPLVNLTGHSLGEHAVQVFFFLSGVLVAQSALRVPGLVDFVTRRSLRIFPGLAVCVVLTAVVVGPMASNLSMAEYFASPLVLTYVMKTLLLTTGAAPLPGVFEGLPAAKLVNHSLWTLKYEVLCYAVLAIMSWCLLRHERTRTFATFALAPLLFVLFLRAPNMHETYSAIDNLRYFLLYFGMGTLTYLHKDHIVIDGRITVLLGIAFTLMRSTPWAELACALFVGALTLQVGSWSMGRLTRYTSANDLSFGVYIYSAPIQQMVLQADPGADAVMVTAWALPPVLVIAWLSWKLVERPSMRLGSSLANALRRKERAPDIAPSHAQGQRRGRWGVFAQANGART
jgi:peptidoglycan/LPS O-acetylase OafA/YrhL